MNPSVEAFIVIEKLATLCATPGISEDVQSAANEQIQLLLKNIISPGLVKLTTSSSGIIIK